MVKTDRRPVFQLHAECQAVSGKNFLNFVKGLAAKVWSLEQFVFGSLDQVADIVNIFGLEAVGGTNGKFKVWPSELRQGPAAALRRKQAAEQRVRDRWWAVRRRRRADPEEYGRLDEALLPEGWRRSSQCS